MTWEKGARINILTGGDASSASVLVIKTIFTDTLKFLSQCQYLIPQRLALPTPLPSRKEHKSQNTDGFVENPNIWILPPFS